MEGDQHDDNKSAGSSDAPSIQAAQAEILRPMVSSGPVTDYRHGDGTTSIMIAPYATTGDTSSLLQAAQRLEEPSPPYPPVIPRPPLLRWRLLGQWGGGAKGGASQEDTQDGQEQDKSVDDSVIMKGTEAAKAADYANYFVSYAYLYHQKHMLTDHRRMSAYYNAIMGNAEAFKGMTVLDVGTGTGVLAVWAAKAGAARVIAVEFTEMARHAQTVVNKNNVGHIVTVVQGSAEDLSVLEPGSVDIVSEWMGYFLLRESMLDSLLRVRDKYLKPDGALYPSHGSMFLALVDDEEERQCKAAEFTQALQEWNAFTYETRQYYGLDLTGLSRQYEDEQRQYYMLSSAWAELKPEQIIGSPVELYRLDLKTCSFQDVKGVTNAPFTFHLLDNQRVSGFAGWFTTDFLGSPEAPVPASTLSTAPEVGYTHWGQQVFYLLEPLDLCAGDRLEGNLNMTRQADNPRLYDVEVSFYVIKDGQPANFISHKYQLP